jgi:hypothetical protein
MHTLLGSSTLAAAALPADAEVSGRVGITIGPPPAPYAERVPPVPGPGYAWRGGHWRWDGRRYAWVRGFYARRPYGRAARVPGHWVHRPGGWFFREDHWS